MSRFILGARRLRAGPVHAHPVGAAATDADLAEIREQIRQLKAILRSAHPGARAAAEGRGSENGGARPRRCGADACARTAASQRASRAAPTPASSGDQRVQSGDLGGAAGRLRQPVAGSRTSTRSAASCPSGDIAPAKRGFSSPSRSWRCRPTSTTRSTATSSFSLSPENTVEVEEAYGALHRGRRTGFAPKFGRFLSGIGYLNDQHQHVWDFYDAPLSYQAFLGGQYQNDGLQVKWVAPTDTFVEFGGEIGNGEGFPGTERNKNGIGNGDSTCTPAATSARATAGAPGCRTCGQRRAGSRVHRRPTSPATTRSCRLLRQAASSRSPTSSGSGRPTATRMRHQLQAAGRILLAARARRPHLRRRRRARPHANRRLRSRPERILRPGRLAVHADWRVGARYDWLDPGTVDYGANGIYLANGSFNPQRDAVMLDWTPSEFSRFRLQFQQAKLRPGSHRQRALRPVHPDPRRAWRAQVLKEARS